MKSKQIINSLFGVFSILFGCNSQENANTFLVKKYYKEGNLMSVQEYSLDSIENGLYLFYNSNGVLVDSANIKNRKFHGQHYQYQNNGTISNVTTYVNGRYRSGLDYDSLGILKYYGGYNYDKDLMFLAEFDSSGRIKNYKGNPIYSCVFEEYYDFGDTISIELLVPNIPNFTTSVNVIYYQGDAKEPIFQINLHPDRFNRITYREERTNSEDIRIANFLKIDDSENRVVITDTLTLQIDDTGKTSFY